LSRFGDGSPLSRSKARLMTLEAMGSYDPSRAKLESHLMNHLKGLQRVVRQNNEVIRAPERVVLERQRLRSYEQELADELGQAPTDDQIADRYGIPPKRLKQIRSFHPGMTEGQLYAIDPESDVASKLPGQDNSEHWVQLVHSELGEMDQRILELSLGLNGHRKLNNLEIAKQLGRTPGAITQRKAKIQQLLDREQLLSPFIPRG
jgi:DNA-directed RNA polymerase specialized sigma subunit